jgi:hypothetical protein
MCAPHSIVSMGENRCYVLNKMVSNYYVKKISILELPNLSISNVFRFGFGVQHTWIKYKNMFVL